jgi:hypothetical protein
MARTLVVAIGGVAERDHEDPVRCATEDGRASGWNRIPMRVEHSLVARLSESGGEPRLRRDNRLRRV